jgi:N-dimethylarginine dimethylaminohydrolase
MTKLFNVEETPVPFQIPSETGRLREVLLCRPDHYRWIPTNAVAQHTLAGDVAFDKAGAVAQFDGLLALFATLGVTCRTLTPDPHLPYQVYTRDSSIVTPFGVFLPQLRMAQRRGEVGAVVAFYAPEGPFFASATAGAIEGGDVHFLRPDLAVIGYSGVRTSEAAAVQFAEMLRARGCTVRLEPFAEHFLHLDVLFCMASDTLAVACIEVLGDGFGAFLRAQGIAVIEASYREVMAMSCNLLAVGEGHVISPAHSVRINDRLRAAGLRVHAPALDIFARGGGSVHCMTMPLRRDR